MIKVLLSSFLQRIELPYDPVIPLLGIYPEENMVWNDTCTPTFTAVLFTIAKTWKQRKCSLTEECINEMRYIYTVEYYSPIKKNKIMPFAATWMDLSNMNGSRDCHTEWHESDREEISYDIPYMWNLKKKWYKWTYLQNKNRLTDLENEFMVAMVVGGRRIRERKNRVKGRLGESLGWTHTHCYILNG